MGIITKAFLVAAVLFGSYSTFVVTRAPSWWSTSQHQWQENTIKAQQFIYNDQSATGKVIVGSSLSCRIKSDSICSAYNLAMQGQSVFDGLAILNSKEKKPETVLIEINMLMRPENKVFTSSITSPLMRGLKEHITSMREENQPLAAIGKYISIKVKHLFPQGAPPTLNHPVNDLFPELLRRRVLAYHEPFDSLEVKEVLIMLHKQVDVLRMQNVEIVFYEMPMDYSVVNSPKENQLRAAFYSEFDTTKYKFIPVPPTGKYQTTDGIHLTEPEALVYTEYLKAQLDCNK